MKIAIIISEARYDIQSSAIRGIIDECRKEKAEVYLFTCNSALGFLPSEDGSFEAENFRLFNYTDYDGIILYGDTIPDREAVSRIAAEIKKTGIPSLSVKERIDGMLYAGINNTTGVRQIIEYMIEKQNKRRIFFIGGPEYNDDSKERLSTHKETLKKYGITPEDGWIVHGDYHPHSGRELFREWYRKRDVFPLPEAVYCANDEMALGVCREAEHLGIRVPEDMLVAGYDNRLISELSKPAITTVPLNGYDLGVLCGKKLLNKILNRNEDIPDEIETSAIFRRSTDPGHTDEGYENAITEMRNFYMNGQNQISNLLDGLREMEVGFADALTWEDFYKILEQHIDIFELDAFYLFAPSRELKPDDRYVLSLLRGESPSTLRSRSEMSIPIAWENGEIKKYPPIPASVFIPQEIIDNTGHGYYVIHPLLHHNQIFGYCVTANSNHAYESEWFTLFIQIVKSAMENLRRKAQLYLMVDTLNHLWIYDKLTGVYNRAGFAEKYDLILHQAGKTGGKVFVLFADLDRLKYVNDTFGHDAGDTFISESANILKQVFYHGEIIMRYGGDEFVVISGDPESINADKSTDEINTLIDNLNKSGNYDFPFSMSVGHITSRAKNITELEGLIEEADKLMYQVKVEKKKVRQD
ncbi:MAG: GGDEF domain-containing protein [Lachnospiraceae bacterium]|nr:GGDEF domain-containing protein [Lachnospiraceae bacterium]